MKLYQEKIEEIPASDLPPQMKKRAERYQNAKKKAASAAGYALLARAMAENGMNPQSVRFLKSGKPVCERGYISLSHSGDLAVCCVSENPVGIDIEKFREIPEREQYKLFSLSDSKAVHNSETFLMVWTMKEAYKKATGCSWEEISQINFLKNGKPIEEYEGFTFHTKRQGEYILSICEKKAIS